MKTASRFLFIGLFILSACTSAGDSSATPGTATEPPQATATQIQILPTPSLPGDSVMWRSLQVRMDQVEITDRFTTEFGTQRLPSGGRKFLWVHVLLKNVGESEIALPVPENFSVLYAESEFKPNYGHRQGYADYTDLGSSLFPEQELDAWLRFDIPDNASLGNLLFVFLPESAQVAVSPSSPTYPYSENKATYIWKCNP